MPSYPSTAKPTFAMRSRGTGPSPWNFSRRSWWRCCCCWRWKAYWRTSSIAGPTPMLRLLERLPFLAPQKCCRYLEFQDFVGAFVDAATAPALQLPARPIERGPAPTPQHLDGAIGGVPGRARGVQLGLGGQQVRVLF